MYYVVRREGFPFYFLWSIWFSLGIDVNHKGRECESFGRAEGPFWSKAKADCICKQMNVTSI